MMSSGFCSRCWNYVDFCDCVNFNFDCEDDYDPSIPAPPEDPAPEVGTVWYFLVPIKDLSLYFEANGVEKVGLSLLLMQESLWTIAPPPGDESLYLSVPVERLPQRQPSLNPLSNQTFNQYIYPWEFNYFNYNGPPIEKIVSLAAEIQECNKKKVGKKACKLLKLLKSMFDSFKVEDIPIPPGLDEAVLNILSTGPLTPEQMLLLLTTLVPIELLQKVNDYAITALDYDWVHRHLVNTLDPDIGYEDKTQPWKDCFKENDLFCQHGSYPFPLPSDSVDMGDPDMRSAKKSKIPKEICDKWCAYLKNPRIVINHGKRAPYAALFDFDKKPVPQWVQDLINESLKSGGDGRIKDPVNAPQDMDVDEPDRDPVKPTPVRGAAPYVGYPFQGTRIWMPSKTSTLNMKGVMNAKKMTPEKAAENVRLVNEWLTMTGQAAWWDDAPPIASTRSAFRTVVPVFDDILLYDDEDDLDILRSRPILPSLSVRSPALSLLYPFTAVNPLDGKDNIPICVNVLDISGTNQTTNLDRTVLVHTVRANKSVETLIDTQLTGLACTVVFVNINPAGAIGVNYNPSYTFTLLSGTDNSLVIEVQGSTANTVTAAGGVGTSGSTGWFTPSTVTDPHLAYRTCRIRNANTVNPTRSVWRVTQTGGGHPNIPNTQRVLMRDTPFVPSFIGFTANGFVNQSGLDAGTQYVSLPISCRPQYQLPICLQLYNETNLKSYSPNSLVSPTTLGYCVGQSGNTGNILAGSLYLPFNPQGITAVTNYDLTVTKSQGQMLLQALVTFGL